MPDREINTKSNRLDKDLTDLFGVLDGGLLPRIKEGLAKGSLTKAGFRDLFPDGAFTLASALTNPLNYKQIAKGKDKKSRAVIDEARDRVSKELSEVLTHSIALERYRGLGSEGDKLEDSSLGENFNRISNVSHAVFWCGKPEALAPMVRVGFLNSSKRLLLDSTMQIHDVSFLAVAMVKIMTEVMQNASDLAQEDRLDTTGGQQLLKRLSAIEEDLAKAKGFLSAYGFDVDSDDRADSEASDGTKE